MRRRIPAVLVLTVGLFGVLGMMGGPVASAHPLGNFTVNRYSGLVLSPGVIEVRYALDMAEVPSFQETTSIDSDADGSISSAERHAWSGRTASGILANLTLAVDGKPVELQVAAHSMRFRSGQAGLATMYFTATYRGRLSQSAGRVHYVDGNDAGSIGWKEVTARSEGGVALRESSVPAASASGELLAYPEDLLSSPLDVDSATFGFHPGRATTMMAPVEQVVSGSPSASGGSFAGLVGRRLTPLILVFSLLLAFGVGAAHALGPGHGKTITAAYLVGHDARARQAAAVGIAVALMHTASVLLLGLVVFVLARSFTADRVYPWLTLGTGLVALALGAGLLIARVRARRHGHAHDREHGHSHHPHDSMALTGPRPMSGRGLVALAVAGGILPSPTSFVVLTGAVAAHRVGYGLALIFAFSLGLAASLVVVGLVALRARTVVSARLAARWVSLIPIASAVVILGFGLFFATRGLVQLS
ncbi:MAG: nickel/cobalt transporter [Actinomycetota bacterium]